VKIWGALPGCRSPGGVFCFLKKGKKMTYGELLAELKKLGPVQLDMTVTVEDTHDEECYGAEFYICDDQHDSLDESHPVIVVP